MQLKKSSLGQEATYLIRKMVLDGKFSEGERLVEDRIAAELGISRTPLREALHRLAQEGLLEKRRTGGYILRTLQRTEIEDAIVVRAMLESYAASLAAKRSTVEQKQNLRNNIMQFKNTDVQDISALVALNEAFHATLREAAHSPLLAQILTELDGVVERLLRPTISTNEAEWSDSDHIAIVECIEKGMAEEASQAMYAHIEHAKETIFANLDKKEQEGKS